MGIFDAAASLVNNAVNTAAQARANKKNIEFQRETNQQNIDFQREVNDTNYQRELDMWNITNEYNHPAQQMQRYKNAGLNPNLIYGQSNTAPSANVGTAQATKVDAPSVSPELREKVTFGSIGHDFLNLLYRQEEVHGLEIDNEIKEETKDDVITKAYYEAERQGVQLAQDRLKLYSDNLDLALKSIELEVSEYTKENRKTLSDISVKQANANVNKTKAETDNLILEQKVIQWKAALTYYETMFKSAQFEHELGKMKLTEEEVKKVTEQIDLIKKQVDKLDNDIEVDNAKLALNGVDTFGDVVRDGYNIYVDSKSRRNGGRGKRKFKINLKKFPKIVKPI